MTADQVIKLRNYHLSDDGTGHTKSDVLIYLFNNELAFVNSRDYIITDDDNELIHAIRINSEDPINQARFPYKIMSGIYSNIHYMEALYNMTNFKTAIKELFLDKGLIDQDQYDHILTWANGIRNQALTPKAPGPYFTDTVLPIPSAPVPEVREDGIHHASPIDMVSKEKLIKDKIIPLIESKFDCVRNGASYTIYTEEPTETAASIKSLIESIGDDLYLASLSTVHNGVIYNPKIQSTVKDFENRVVEILPKDEKRNNKSVCVLHIEAYGVRVDFKLDIIYRSSSDPFDPRDWSNKITKKVNNYVDNFESDVVTLSRSNRSISATISSTNISNDLDNLVNKMNSLDAERVVFRLGSKSAEFIIGDSSTVESFKERMKDIMPSNNDQVVTGNVGIDNAGASVVYTLKVKYYNEADCAAIIDGVYYNTMAEACAHGGTIILNKDVVESFEVPAGKDVTINLNGKSIANVEGSTTIFNKGNLTITGEGTVDNVSHQRPVLYNDEGATLTILSGTFVRSKEAGVGPKDSGGNSYYVIQNVGTMVIGADGEENNITVEANGKFSSLITNGFSKTPTTPKQATMTIYGGTFTGGINTVKNDEYGHLTINGGTFNNYAQYSLLNWNVCTVNGGTFNATNLPVVCNGYYGESSIGDLTITGGVFESGTAECLTVFEKYPSEDIKVRGGTFSSDPSKYVISNYVSEFDGSTGKYVVRVKKVVEVVEERIDEFMDSVDEKSLVIEPDPEQNNVYSITTSNGNISQSGLFDEIVSIDGVTSIVVSDGTNEVTYNTGDDLERFKDAVNNMVPKANEAEEVILTLTINC